MPNKQEQSTQTPSEKSKQFYTEGEATVMLTSIKKIAKRPIKIADSKKSRYEVFVELYNTYKSIQTSKFTVQDFCAAANEADFKITTHQANNYLRRMRTDAKESAATNDKA